MTASNIDTVDLAVDLSIVIVSYNTREMLRSCLLALPGATEGLTTEIWVVDNNSPDQSADMVAAEFPVVHVIANTDNPGFARANNQALQQCRGRNIVILNPDTEAEPLSLTQMVRYLGAHPEVGVVGPKLLNTDGTLQPNGRRFPTIGREFLTTTGLDALRRAAFERAEFMRTDFDATCEVDQVSGACLMMPGEVMRHVGLLDADFFMFYEDTEWCWRVHQRGYKVVYLGEARVVHHWMGSVRQMGRASAAHLRASAHLYYRKTGGQAGQVCLCGVLFLAALRAEVLHHGAALKRRLRRTHSLR